MAVKIAQREIKFFSELANGSDFDVRPNVYTSTLADNVTGRVKAEITVDVTVGMGLTNYQILNDGNTSSTTDTDYKIYKQDANFIAEGFTVGGNIELSYAVSVSTQVGEISVDTFTYYTVPFTVTSITNDTLFIDCTGTAAEIERLHDSVNNTGNIRYDTEAYIAINPSFTALEFAYNLVENDSGNSSLTSELTNSTNIIKVRGIPTNTGGGEVSGEATSRNKAWVMGGVTAELVDKVFNYNTLASDDQLFTNQYVITHEFTIPYYYDGEDDNLSNTVNAPDLYNGTSSPKYIYQTTWFTDINDPNTGSTVLYDTSRGDSGYLDESLNGNTNPYSITGLTYTNLASGEEVDQLYIGEPVKVEFNVTNGFNNFKTDQRTVIAHGAVVGSDEYEFSENEFNDVWTFETLRNVAGVAAVDGVAITNYEVVYNSVSSISVSFEVNFTNAQNARLEEGQYYLLAFQVMDDDWTNASAAPSRKVHLKVDYNQYEKNNDIEGLYGVARFEQIPHPEPLEVNPIDSTGYTNGQYDIEEGALSLVEFWLDNSLDAELTNLNFKIGVWNETEKELHGTLRSTSLDLSDSVYANGTWQIHLNDVVGYPLADGDQFNYKKITTGKLVGTKQFYTMLVGYRLPWQDWLAFSEAPTEFYNFEEPNNGLNQKSNKYDTDADYQVRLFIDADVSQNGISTTYRTRSEVINVYNYDEDDSLLNDTYTCTIGTFDEEDVSIEDNIIVEGYTKIVSTFTPKDPPTLTETIDFTEVATNWKRVAYGELFLNGGDPDAIASRVASVPPDASQLDGWSNGFANDTDIFSGGFAPGTFVNKEDLGLYNSTVSSITCNENLNAYYGCVSNDSYESYGITGTMYSTDSDNDSIGYVICAITDALGNEHTLSLAATAGGTLNGPNPAYDGTDNTVNSLITTNTTVKLDLVYNLGKLDCMHLDSIDTGALVGGWNSVGGAGGNNGIQFQVSRDGANIQCDLVFTTLNGNTYSTIGGATNILNPIIYNLNDNQETQKFGGANSIGFCFWSQDQGGFKDVVISLPDADYWGAVRIEPEQSSSDNGLYELSTDIEGNTRNLLKQDEGIEGDSILSSLSWTGSYFKLQALVNTPLITNGQAYKISAELGSNILSVDPNGILDYLAVFAWVDADIPNELNVMFNSGVSSSSITGVSLTNSGGINIDSIKEVDENFITYNLSGDMGETQGLTIDFSGTDIVRLTDSVALTTTSIDVTNDI